MTFYLLILDKFYSTTLLLLRHQLACPAHQARTEIQDLHCQGYHFKACRVCRAESNRTSKFFQLKLEKAQKPILDNLQQHDMIQRGKRLLENEQRPFIDRHRGCGLFATISWNTMRGCFCAEKM